MIRRGWLVLEVLRSYARARRVMRGPLPDAVAAQRAGAGSVPMHLGTASNEARRLAAATERTLRYVPTDARCLSQALTLTRLLARRDIPASLVIGVRRKDEFAAHAWVEHQGRALLPTSSEYTRMTEL